MTCEVLIAVAVQVTDGVNGSATSQTERFAAALLAAIRTRMFGVPDRCSGAVRVGVAYTSRCAPALTKLPGWQDASSTSFSCPAAGPPTDVSAPVVFPPARGRSSTAFDAGFG